MATTYTHSVTLADGTLATRTSQNRQYSHAVLATSVEKGEFAASWSSRLDLAEKEAARLRAQGARWSPRLTSVRVVPATRIEHTTKPATGKQAARMAAKRGASAARMVGYALLPENTISQFEVYLKYAVEQAVEAAQYAHRS